MPLVVLTEKSKDEIQRWIDDQKEQGNICSPAMAYLQELIDNSIVHDPKSFLPIIWG